MDLTNLKSIQQTHEANGGKFVGSVIWWDIPSSGIASDRLEQAALAAGFPAKYLPNPITPIGAFRRAVERSKTGLKQKDKKEIRLEYIKDEGQTNEDFIVLGLCQRNIDAANEKVEFDQIATIKFDKKSYLIECYPYHDLVETIRDNWGTCRLHSSDDIRGILVALAKEVGIPLRRAGGTYWIPEQYQGLIDSVSTLMESISPKNTVHQLPLYESATTGQALTVAAQDSLGNELEQLQKDIDELLQDPKVRDKTLNNRFVDVQALRSRVELFTGVLKFTADEVENKLFSLEQVLAARLGIQLKPKKPTAPLQVVPDPEPAPQLTQFIPSQSAVGF